MSPTAPLGGQTAPLGNFPPGGGARYRKIAQLAAPALGISVDLGDLPADVDEINVRLDCAPSLDSLTTITGGKRIGYLVLPGDDGAGGNGSLLGPAAVRPTPGPNPTLDVPAKLENWQISSGLSAGEASLELHWAYNRTPFLEDLSTGVLRIAFTFDDSSVETGEISYADLQRLLPSYAGSAGYVQLPSNTYPWLQPTDVGKTVVSVTLTVVAAFGTGLTAGSSFQLASGQGGAHPQGELGSIDPSATGAVTTPVSCLISTDEGGLEFFFNFVGAIPVTEVETKTLDPAPFGGYMDSSIEIEILEERIGETLTEAILTITTAFSPGLNTSSTLAIQIEGGTEGEFGEVDPSTLASMSTVSPGYLVGTGDVLTAILRLRSDATPEIPPATSGLTDNVDIITDGSYGWDDNGTLEIQINRLQEYGLAVAAYMYHTGASEDEITPTKLIGQVALKSESSAFKPRLTFLCATGKWPALTTLEVTA